MAIPGYTVTIGERPASSLAAASTANCFMAGFSERGSVTDPILIRSPKEALEKLGNRLTGEPIAYDSIDAFFHEGGTVLYFSRINPGAGTGTKEVVDEESKKDLKFSAKTPGLWGNSIKIAVTKVSTTYSFVVKYEGVAVEQSPSFTTTQEAVEWAVFNSNYVVVAKEAESSAIPKTQEVTLAGGSYTTGSATETQVKEAIERFPLDLGAGQLIAPGQTSEAIHKFMLEQAGARNRRAILDDPDTATYGEIVSHATAMRGSFAKFGTMAAPQLKIPGLTGGTSTWRTIPASAAWAGVISRAEANGYSPNIAAAGAKRGNFQYAFGVTQTYPNAGVEALNNAGVVLIKPVRGVPTAFGNRTLVNSVTEPNWVSFSGSRTIMRIASVAGEVLEGYEFEQIDGKGLVFKRLEAELANRACKPLYEEGSLYGDTPEEAFAVETGPDVNTEITIAAEEIRAQIAVRISPSGERLNVEIVKVPTTESLIA